MARGAVRCGGGLAELSGGGFEGAKYIVRIDGDITQDAELTVRDGENKSKWS